MRSRCIWVGAVVLAACAPSTEPTEGNVDVDALRSAITPELEDRVTANGRIRAFGQAQVPQELNADEAKQFAAMIVEQYGPLKRLGDLELCGPIHYAESPYEMPANYDFEFNARTIGPVYYTTACKGNTPRVLVSFSSYNRNAFDGTADGMGGEEAQLRAFSPKELRERLDLPAQAVMKAFNRFGHRIQRISLLRPAAHEDRFAMKWRIELENAADVRTTKGKQQSTREVIFGPSWGPHGEKSAVSRFGVKADLHPTADSVAWIRRIDGKPQSVPRVVNVNGTLYVDFLEGK